MRGQLVPALIASLLLEGVDPQTVEQAVARTCDIRLGQSISGDNPTYRTFAFEQAGLLDRSSIGGGS